MASTLVSPEPIAPRLQSMECIPESPPTANRAEIIVWSALREAFGDDEGALYFRCPIIEPEKRGRHEPDIVLILPEVGVFILECKGCTADQIERIDGSTWWMREDWYRRRERPLEQLDRQTYAFRDAVLHPIQLEKKIPVHRRIALPFVEAAEWERRGFEHLSVTERILTKGDLASAALREHFRAVGTSMRQDEYEAIRNRLGAQSSGHRRSTGDGTVRVVRYDGAPPSAEDIVDIVGAASVEEIRASGAFTYLVATVSLEMRRSDEGLAPVHQMGVPNGAGEERAQMVFHKVLRHFLRQRDIHVLSRFLARTKLGRSMRSVAETDHKFDQLRRDVYEWEEVMKDLAARGILLDKGIPSSIEESIVNPSLLSVVEELQTHYYDRLPDGSPPFEKAARAFLDYEYDPSPTIIMEGFSFLRPLQEHYIERCLDSNANVILIHAYRDKQAYGFRAMQDTYDLSFLDEVGAETYQTPFRTEDTDLDVLKRFLFAGSSPKQSFRDDGSVVLMKCEHRREEVQECVRSIRELLVERAGDETFEVRDVIVVARDRDEYRQLLVDEAEIQAREDDPDCIPRPLFREPPRKLLLTPVGRFILTLFEVFEDGTFKMEPQQFASFLGSGLLGPKVRKTTDRFADVTEQFFAHARRLDEWKHRLEKLDMAIRTEHRVARLPSERVTEDDVRVWREALDTVCTLGNRLFDDERHTIQDLLRRLQSELNTLAEENLLEQERELLKRIKKLLDELQQEPSPIEISMDELGDAIGGLLQERDQYEQDQEEERARREGRVVITGPKGVDGSSQKMLYYLSVDDRHVPKPYSEPWPYGENDLSSHTEQERYLFLAVVRATQQKLQLFYPQVDNDRRNEPSIFLEDVRNIWSPDRPEFQTPRRGEESALDGAESDSDEDEEKAAVEVPAPRDEYPLELIMHATLCPYRYKIEELDSSTRTYRSDWQLPFAVQGLALERTFDKMIGSTIAPTRNSDGGYAEDIFEWFESARREIWGDVKSLVPGFRAVDWVSVERGVLKTFGNIAQHFGQSTFPLRIEQAEPSSITVNVEDRTYIVDATPNFIIRQGEIPRPFDTDLVHQEWLLPRGEDNRSTGKTEVEVFQEWAEIIRAAYRYNHYTGNPPRDVREDYMEAQSLLRECITAIERHGFPKKDGDHCKYCSARAECLGISLDRDA